MRKVKVLVVDDSATMRGVVSAILQRDPDIDVIGSASNAAEARSAIKALDPDVITLDIEMPDMDGLEFLEKIMRLRPMPVVMVSSLTQRGAEASIRALEVGAVDCVGKPTGGVSGSEDFAGLPEKVKAAARARMRPRQDGAPIRARSEAFRPNGSVVAIGSSTGGVEALLTVLSGFPANCPPTVVTQHMPATFTKSFAERLNRSCAAEVSEAYDGAPVETGRIYIAPGGAAHLEIAGNSQLRCRLVPGDPVNGHRPSVDVLFNSVARTVGSRSVGVILTGMGRDGATGLLTMSKAGARTVGQDESSCVVYGMPKVAFEIGAVQRQLPLERVGSEILDLCNSERRERH